MDKTEFFLWVIAVLSIVGFVFMMVIVVSDYVQCERFGTEFAVRTKILNGDCYLELRDGYLIRQDKYLELIEGKY